MFLSLLTIDMGDNPDRPRPGRQWLRNLYHVHQRLCMAFPSKSRKQHDPDFLAPYAPDDFPEQRHLADKKKTEVDPHLLAQVHSQRNADSGFLFRIDPQPGGRAAILVQSAVEPDWDYAFHNADYLLAAPPQVKPFEFRPAEGQVYRFSLLANPTKRIAKVVDGDPELKGKRVGLLREEEQIKWLIRKGHDGGGFEILLKEVDEPDGGTRLVPRVSVQREGKRKGRKHEVDQEHVTTHLAVRFDGFLRITDADSFRETLVKGIGPAKAFGFGLLSLARA